MCPAFCFSKLLRQVLTLFLLQTFLLAAVQYKVLRSTKWHVYTWRYSSVCSSADWLEACQKKKSPQAAQTHTLYSGLSSFKRKSFSSAAQPATTSPTDVLFSSAQVLPGLISWLGLFQVAQSSGQTEINSHISLPDESQPSSDDDEAPLWLWEMCWSWGYASGRMRRAGETCLNLTMHVTSNFVTVWLQLCIFSAETWNTFFSLCLCGSVFTHILNTVLVSQKFQKCVKNVL